MATEQEIDLELARNAELQAELMDLERRAAIKARAEDRDKTLSAVRESNADLEARIAELKGTTGRTKSASAPPAPPAPPRPAVPPIDRPADEADASKE